MSPLQLSYGGISGYCIFWVLCGLAAILFFYRIYQLSRYLLLGKRGEKISELPRRSLTTVAQVVGQSPQFKSITLQDQAGLGHIMIAWGFFIFFTYYLLFIVIAMGCGESKLFKTDLFYYYTWVMDFASLFVIVAALWGIIRRYIVIPSRLKGEQTFEALVILTTVLIHPITHLLKVASGIALNLPPAGLGFFLPPVSGLLSQLFSPGDHWVQSAHSIIFWIHWNVVLFVLVFIPYSRYLHVIAAPLNIFFVPSRARGALMTLNFKEGERLGLSQITDFTQKQLLDLYSCVACGRCQDACPAYATGKPLSPKQIVQNLSKEFLQSGPALLKHSSPPTTDSTSIHLGEGITEVEIRSCTMCGACVETCPVSINQIDKLLELRRSLVYEGRFERGQERALKRVAQYFNPWGIPWNRRSKNIALEECREGERYDCLYWIGCTAAFDETAQAIAQATATILRAAGVRFATCGVKEKCCGDFVRRLGDEGLFQRLAEENIRELNRFNFDFILTHCPHCFNTFKNEYPDFRGKFKVLHHTQLFRELMRDKRIKVYPSKEKVIYHDPCYLGRFNEEYHAPREVLRELCGEIDEFQRNRSKSFCCGAGGGYLWKEFEEGERISVERAREALTASPHIITTACPFCLLMLEEALHLVGSDDTIKVRDVAQMIERSLC